MKKKNNQPKSKSKDKQKDDNKGITWRHLVITGMICITVLLVAAIFGLGWISDSIASDLGTTIESVSEIAGTIADTSIGSFGEIAESNPEVALALSGADVDDEVLMLAALKGLQMDADIDMDFNGYFTTRTERKLVKTDLNCLDEFEYRSLLSENAFQPNTKEFTEMLEGNMELTDHGCQKYHIEGNVTYYKCPKHNCEMKEVVKEVSDEFIPVDISVSRISAAAGGK